MAVMMIAMASRQAISDWTGTASFTVWLFAQSPQILENHHRQSVDGLSGLFLAQWMLGDLTNLIGSLLTHQLPFQIAIAVYFCAIDLCILSQYIYYASRARARTGADTGPPPHSVRVRSQSRRRDVEALAASILRSGSGNRRPRYHTFSTRSATVSGRRPEIHPAWYEDARTAPAPAGGARSRHRPRAATHAALPWTAAAHAGHDERNSSDSLLPSSASQDFAAAASREASAAAKQSKLPRRQEREHEHRRGRDMSRAAESYIAAAFQSAESAPASASGSESGDSGGTLTPIAPAPVLPSMGTPARATSLTAASFASSSRPASLEQEEHDERAAAASASHQRRMTAILAGQMHDGRTAAQIAVAASRSRSPRCSATVRSSNSIAGNGAHLHHAGCKTLQRRSSSGLVLLACGLVFSISASSYSSGGNRSPVPGASTTRWRAPRAAARDAHARPSASGASHFPARFVGGARSMLQPPVSAPVPGCGAACSASASHAAAAPDAAWDGYAARWRHPQVLYFPTLQAQTTSDATVPLGNGTCHRHDEGGGGTGSPSAPAPSLERVLGRISAWTCTVLYMTSRLPQIWVNLSRRSVEGLSILLFLSAFMGNLLYTISILVNPRSSGPGARAYLAESTPFLLGSGGTLIFDLIIVAQWAAWRGNGPEPIAYLRSSARTLNTSSGGRARSDSLMFRHAGLAGAGRSRSRSGSLGSPASPVVRYRRFVIDGHGSAHGPPRQSMTQSLLLDVHGGPLLSSLARSRSRSKLGIGGSHDVAGRSACQSRQSLGQHYDEDDDVGSIASGQQSPVVPLCMFSSLQEEQLRKVQLVQERTPLLQ